MPALFRLVDGEQPTLLFDECDTIFGPRANGNSEDVRALLNAGHRRGVPAYRCVGEGSKQEPRAFDCFCPVALAGIGDLPDTITDRSVVVRMRRRAPDEGVASFRRREVTGPGNTLRNELADWANSHVEQRSTYVPEMPHGITDRPADVWEPLVAIADLAGGAWPSRARRSAVVLNGQRQSSDPSIGVRLLSDVRDAYESTGWPARLATDDLLKVLCDRDDATWGDLRGKAIDSRFLAQRLKPYGVTPQKFREGDQTKRGDPLADLRGPWARYLSPPSGEVEQREHPEQCR